MDFEPSTVVRPSSASGGDEEAWQPSASATATAAAVAAAAAAATAREEDKEEDGSMDSRDNGLGTVFVA